MPEFTKFPDAAGFFPGQCFTCGTATGPFYFLGEAAGYGTIIIHPHCVIELGRNEGMASAAEMESMERELTEAGHQLKELADELNTERRTQLKVVSLETARKLIRPPQAKKPKTKTPAA